MSWSRFIAALSLLVLCGLFGTLTVVAAQDDAAAEQPAASEGAAEEEIELTTEQAKGLMAEKLGMAPIKGPATFDLGAMAEINIPEGYQGLNGDDTRKLLTAYGNLTGDDEVGCIEPLAEDWFVVFEFSDDGYVKDDDKDELDADAMLENMQSSDEPANEMRRQMGLDELETVGWVVPPNYDPQTHNLQWGIRIRDKATGSESVNYQTRLLGRRGVMRATLVCDPTIMESVMPDFKKLIADYSFKSGEDYASFQSGDKIAQYGLAALVTGGAAAVALKTGLLAKLGIVLAKAWKVVVFGVVALLAAIGKLLGMRKSSTS